MASIPDETPAEHIRNVLQILVAPAEQVISEDVPAIMSFRTVDINAACIRLMEALAKLTGLAPHRH